MKIKVGSSLSMKLGPLMVADSEWGHLIIDIRTASSLETAKGR